MITFLEIQGQNNIKHNKLENSIRLTHHYK